ncbi:MAG TPA: oligosaccharide flippase family protein [Bacteroidales bacterium]|nr:oligosaccharide flippase family protein [Bacteroidales bacterium]
MSFRKNLFKNILVLGGYSYTTQIISFLSTIVLSRLLLPAEYGFVALITVFTGFINQFADAGLSYIIIRSDYKRLFQSTIYYLAIAIGVLLAVIVVLLAYPISLFYKDPALILPTIIMSSTFILRSFITVPYGILAKELKFNKLGMIELVCTLVEITLMIVFAWLKFSYWSLIIPSIFGNVLRIILYNANSDIRFKFMKRKYLLVGIRKAKSIIGNLTGFNLLNYWARNSDNLIIGKVFGSDSLGIYNRAYKILGLALGVMTNLFGKVLYPSIKNLSGKGGDINKEYMNTLGIISIMNFPASVLLIFFSEPLVRLLWSERWIQVAELLPYVGILILTQTLNSTTGNIFILKGKERALMLLGIPTNIVIIAAIAAGAFFSMLHVLRFYAIASVVFDIPMTVYFGFKKSFGFENKVILKFWLPKILLSIMLIVTVWVSLTWLTILLISLYLLHLIVDQKEDIFSLYKILIKRFKNSDN